MSNAGGERVAAQCSCGAKYKVRREIVGKKTRCAKCNQLFLVVDPQPNPTDDSSSLFGALAEVEQRGSAIESRRGVAHGSCPVCASPMADGAAICVECGFEPSSGRTRKTVRVDAQPVGGRARALALGAGSFVLGCVLAGVAAAVAAVVWMVVVIITHLMYGVVAIGLGALVGGGMRIGYRNENARAGLIAALIAIAGILFAKFLLYSFVVSTVLSMATGQLSEKRKQLKYAMTEEVLDQQGIKSQTEREAKRQDAARQAEAMVNRMTDDEVDAKSQEIKKTRAGLLAANDPFTKLEQVERLVTHAADRRAEHEGARHGSERAARLYLEELRRVSGLSDEDRADELLDLDDWEAGGKWEDEEYVHDHLVVRLVEDEYDRKRKNDPESYRGWSPNDAQWKGKFREHKRAIEHMPHEARIERLKAFERQDQENEWRDEIAHHQAEVRVKLAGLAPFDEQRTTIFDEEYAKAEALSGAALDNARKAVDEWKDKGRYEKPECVRAELIYAMVDDALETDGVADVDDEHWETIDDRWKEAYAASVAKVDAIPADDHPQRLREITAEQERKSDELAAKSIEQREAEARKEVEEGLEQEFGGFFTSMFVPFDSIWILLAVVAAYRIAAGEGD